MSQLDKVLKFIDDNQPRFIDNLRKAVAIKNVSAWKARSFHTYLNLCKTRGMYIICMFHLNRASRQRSINFRK